MLRHRTECGCAECVLKAEPTAKRRDVGFVLWLLGEHRIPVRLHRDADGSLHIWDLEPLPAMLETAPPARTVPRVAEEDECDCELHRAARAGAL